MHKICLLLLWKSERRKNNCYLVFGDKNIETIDQKKLVKVQGFSHKGNGRWEYKRL